jgi:Alpha-amylase/4-alpha-glucanotransferase, C-terminal
LQIHYRSEENQKENIAKVKLWADGAVSSEGKLNPLRVSKIFEIPEGKNEIRITYSVENLGSAPVHVNHLMEIPLYLTGDKKSISLRSDAGESDFLKPEIFRTKALEVHAGENDIRVKINLLEARRVFKYPLETYARTDGGYDSIYQGTVLSLLMPLDLKPKESYSWNLNLTLI